MCNCIEKVSEDIKSKLLENPDVLRVAFVLIPSTMTKNPKVGIHCTVKTFNSLKKGGEKGVESTMTVLAAFCPFCGEKYEQA